MSSIANPSYRKRPLYHATLLASMGLFASFIMVLGNIATREDINLRIKEDMQASLEQVIPSTLHDNDLFEDTFTFTTKIKLSQTEQVKVYRAREKNKIMAIAFESSAVGYSGDIKVIMGVNMKGELLGVRVISHAETPGLGDKIEIKKNDWITKFTGLSRLNPPPEKWKVKKDGGYFDQFTGATITPRAVVKAVHKGLIFFSEIKQKNTFETNIADSKEISDENISK